MWGAAVRHLNQPGKVLKLLPTLVQTNFLILDLSKKSKLNLDDHIRYGI